MIIRGDVPTLWPKIIPCTLFQFNHLVKKGQLFLIIIRRRCKRYISILLIDQFTDLTGFKTADPATFDLLLNQLLTLSFHLLNLSLIHLLAKIVAGHLGLGPLSHLSQLSSRTCLLLSNSDALLLILFTPFNELLLVREIVEVCCCAPSFHKNGAVFDIKVQ